MKLSRQEKIVYNLIEEGYKIGYIAEQMGISPQTASTYKNRIKDKLGVDDIRNDHHIVKKYKKTLIRVHYNQGENTSEARDKNGMCVAFYDFDSDKFEVLDDLQGYTQEEIIEEMHTDRKEYDNCPTDESDQSN